MAAKDIGNIIQDILLKYWIYSPVRKFNILYLWLALQIDFYDILQYFYQSKSCKIPIQRLIIFYSFLTNDFYELLAVNIPKLITR